MWEVKSTHMCGVWIVMTKSGKTRFSLRWWEYYIDVMSFLVYDSALIYVSCVYASNVSPQLLLSILSLWFILMTLTLLEKWFYERYKSGICSCQSLGYSKLKIVGFLIKNRPEVHVWDSPAQTNKSSPLGATVLGAIYGAEQENMEIWNSIIRTLIL